MAQPDPTVDIRRRVLESDALAANRISTRSWTDELDGGVTRMGRRSATEDDRAALAAFLAGDA